MKIRVGTLLLDLDGGMLRHPETNAPWTVGSVLTTAALGAPPPGLNYTEAEQTTRYKMAVDIHDVMKAMWAGDLEATVNLTPEMIVMLKADIMRGFAPIVAGQIALILNDEPIAHLN